VSGGTRFVPGLKRVLPPVRLVWIGLLGLAIYGAWFLNGLGWASLVILPIAAVCTDLLFQRFRFPTVRPPDAAIATGLFLTLLLPPTVPVLAGALVSVVAISARHLLRFRSRPLFNPAALGVVIGTLLLGLAPAWWIAVSPAEEIAVVALGVLLILRSPHTWRLPVVFLGAYAVISIVPRLLFGEASTLSILVLGALDPVVVFFGLFMVTEPKTAPKNPHLHPLFAAIVALLVALLDPFLPTLGILLALMAGNVILFLFEGSKPVEQVAPQVPRALRRAAKRKGRRAPSVVRWPVSQRIAAGLVVVLLLAIGSSALGPTAGGGGSAPLLSTPIGSAPSPPPTTAGCTRDNPSIPSNIASALHQRLGPSVLLSYDSSTGVVVFYDTVNHVTVTETDLYEDFGYAEFNGDDFAVSGCSA
jgi:Na+-translocating ferredoxin:NAD+ oxidoreductase RnfD subunit